jgi:hypothetical protein
MATSSKHEKNINPIAVMFKFILILVLFAVGPAAKYGVASLMLEALHDQFQEIAEQAREALTKEFGENDPTINGYMQERFSSIPGFCTSSAHASEKKEICDAYADLNDAELTGMIAFWFSTLIPVLLGIGTIVQLHKNATRDTSEGWVIPGIMKSLNWILGLTAAALAWALAQILGALQLPTMIALGIALVPILILLWLQNKVVKSYTRGVFRMKIEPPDAKEIIKDYLEGE